MILTTTKCGQFGHPEFVLEADESAVPDIYLREMAENIENMIAQGSVFQPGETFQIGWMLARVQLHDPSHLTLEEPDMASLPIRWIPGVTHTLRQNMLQVFMLDSVSLRDEMQVPSIQQSLVTCDRYTDSDFFMARSGARNEQDSGWFVGCLGDGHDHNDPANLRCVSLYEAYLGQKGIQNFVTFPEGSMIVVERESGLSIFKDGRPLDIVGGGFLDAWLARRAKGEARGTYPE